MTATRPPAAPASPELGGPDPLATPAAAPVPDEAVGRLTRWFGPLTALRVVALLVAVAFLGGAVGWALSQHDRDPLSATDVGFMRDMSYHHEQAIEMSLILLGKDSVDADLKSFAQEFIIDQRYEQGLFNAILDRYGYSAEVGKTVMGWMGPPLPRDSMEGLATESQMAALRAATGTKAEALFVALMTEHHLGGLHMADWEARKGKDRTVRNVAKAMVTTQRGEVIDLNSYRLRHDLPLEKGFSDPLEDQRLNPLSLDTD
ncbi:DUF305 domain-containing protein [Aquihabitans sp. G128]|uniref:DUF305 domain-containing protein n=1 Tax=Aquihabitans sp. G128 TaxID=2849779 RepID=UPI001C2403AB|nr:DUF305 domain-containing protein [Aquihabitans sp. G128]QXC62776.1 DUF305 domain-containing protein [Aquihabitans sp. G128]